MATTTTTTTTAIKIIIIIMDYTKLLHQIKISPGCLLKKPLK